MSAVHFIHTLRKSPKLHSILWQGVRFRKPWRKGGPLQNKLDPDKDFYMEEDFENEPVAYLDPSPDSPMKPKKLTKWEERQQQKELLKKQILKKKEFKEYFPKEPSLLTWAARAQIKHLHSTDPEQWDIDALSRSFPVSKFAIKSILRSKQIPYDRQEINKHDRTVFKNWIKMKEQAKAYIEGAEVEPEYRVLLDDEDRRSRLVNAAGITDLPIPQERHIIQTMTDIAEDARPAVKRVFSIILETHQPNQDSLHANKEDSQYIKFDNHEMKALLENIAKLNSDNLTVPEDEMEDVVELEGSERLIGLPGDGRVPGDYRSKSAIATESDFRRSKQQRFRTNVKYDEMGQVSEQVSKGMPDIRQEKWMDNRHREHRAHLGNHSGKAGNHGVEQTRFRKSLKDNGDRFGDQRDAYQSETDNSYFCSKYDKRNSKSYKEQNKQKFPKAQVDTHERSFARTRDRPENPDFTADEFGGRFQDNGSYKLTGKLEDIYLLNKPNKEHKSKNKWVNRDKTSYKSKYE